MHPVVIILLVGFIVRMTFKVLLSHNRFPLFAGLVLSLLMLAVAVADGAYVVTVDMPMAPKVDVGSMKRIAIIHFEGDRAEQIGNTLGSILQQTHRFEILERAQIENILKEHNLNFTGVIDETTASNIGKVLGVQGLIYGTVPTYHVGDDEGRTLVKAVVGYETKYDKKGNPYKQEVWGQVEAPMLTRRGECNVTFKLVNITTGVIIAQETYTESESQQQIDHPNAKPVELWSESEFKDQLARRVATQFTHVIAPYSIALRLEWDNDARDEAALNYVQIGMYDEAVGSLQRRLEQLKADTKSREKEQGKDKYVAAVYYNLGLLALQKRRWEETTTLLKQAIAASITKPQNEHRQALSTVQQMVETWARIRSSPP